jgi:hypothetical protein
MPRSDRIELARSAFPFVAVAAFASCPALLRADDAVRTASHATAAQSEAESARRLELDKQLVRRKGGDASALSEAVQLSRDLTPSDAIRLYDAVASAHLEAGSLDLAAEARRALVERWPEQPAAREALRWLVRLYSSSEVVHARRRRDEGLSDAADGNPAQLDKPLLTYAVHLSANVAALGAPGSKDSAIAFQRAVAVRRLGDEKTALAALTSIEHASADDPWRGPALVENWLAEGREGACPLPTIVCRRIAAPPRLDGRLDDDCWRTEQEAEDQDAATRVRFACDDEYLYAAISCRKSPDVEYPVDDRPRPRDGDVEEHDHVWLRVDVDRDYATCFELGVDSRGWTADRCWDDAAWNPAWYVAAGETAEGGAARWTVEWAAPFNELGGRSPQSGDAWAVKWDRGLPGAGPQGVASDGPAGFRVLLFE